MILKDVIEKSYYASVGYIEEYTDVDKLEQYIVYNLKVLNHFKGVIHCTTYKNTDKDLSNEVDKVWQKYFPGCVSINNGISRGHSFGACDNDDAVFDYCKTNNIEWVCKSANDIILEEEVLNIHVDESDFYYFNGIGYGGLATYGFDFNKIIKEDFYPQTNFYFLRVSKCDYLNDRSHVNEIYEKVSKVFNYSGRAWEYGFKSCETLLADCVRRNNLTTFHLIDVESYIKLLNFIKSNGVHDPSHKNIMLSGVCHFHFSNQIITKI